MMRNNKFLIRAAVFALAALMLACAFSAAALAAEAPDDQQITDEQPVDGEGEGQQDEQTPGITPTEPPEEYYEPAVEEPTQAPEDSGDGGNGYDEYAEEIENNQSSYTEPPYLFELPTTAEGEIQPATYVVLPDVEVSEASLFSGVVMWLCVAVGIAVVVGVMVSRRTHRRV